MIHDRDIMRRQVPDHVDILLEESQVDACGVVINQITQLAFVHQFFNFSHRTGIDEGMIHEQGLPFCSASSMRSVPCSTFSVIGFSTQTCRPVSRALFGQLVMSGHRCCDGDGVDIGAFIKVVYVVV